jgi:ATP-dependent Clp protease ATP-binding subunit ClpA
MNISDFLKNNKYIKNMNEYVKKNNIINYGFEEEIDELVRGLCRLKKSNVLLLGKAGVGKTAVVEKLCQLINDKKVPSFMQNKTVLEMSLNGAVAGTQYRGQLEERIEEVLNFASNNKNIIIFIDEIHNILKANSSNGENISVGDMLKPYMARSDVSLIGATTNEEYKMSIARNSAMDRRFLKLNINEPDKTQTIKILESCKTKYQEHYGIKLSKKDILNVVNKAQKQKGTFPDKAFDELENYCYIKSNKGE